MEQSTYFASVTFLDMVVTPDHSCCPKCSKSAKIRWTAFRSAIDLNTERATFLGVTVGVYRCEPCRRYFRIQPSFLQRSATYTKTVMSTAISSVIEDGMAVTRVPRRMSRDFGIEPSEGIIRYWLRKGAVPISWEKYEQFIRSSFSGILCIDEMYQGKISILLATDPSGSFGDKLVAYQLLEGKVSSNDVENFLQRMRSIGIEPEEIITDGSALYPDVIRKTWPVAAHQVCLFHKTHKMVRAVGNAVKELKGKIPKIQKSGVGGITMENRRKGAKLVRKLYSEKKGIREISRLTGHSRNTIKKWLHSTDSRDETATSDTEELTPSLLKKKARPPSSLPPDWESWEQVGRVKELLANARYILSKRKENLGDEDHYILQTLYGSPLGDDVRLIVDFAQSWYGIWNGDSSVRQNQIEAEIRWNNFIRANSSARFQALKRFTSTLDIKLFRSLSHFLLNPKWESTSNGVERYCRKIRHIQSSHYNFRSKEIIAKVIERSAILQLKAV